MFHLLGQCTALYGSLNILYRFYPYLIPSFYVDSKLRNNSGNQFVMISGASDGIGKTYAQYFLKQGFNLILMGRSKVKIESIVQEMGSFTQSFDSQTLQSYQN